MGRDIRGETGGQRKREKRRGGKINENRQGNEKQTPAADEGLAEP